MNEMNVQAEPRSLGPYCGACWFPSSKPKFELSAVGLCRACESEVKRPSLSSDTWNALEEQFSELIRKAVELETPNFDVLVPVSGGKDSITQVVRANQHGARILAVSVDYGVKTKVGRHNLDCVPNVGNNVHLQTYRPPLGLHRRLILDGLFTYGDPDFYSHTLLHAYPLHQALALNIPLVVLGENSAAQYGGTAELAQLSGMTRDWFESYAVSGDRSVFEAAERLGIERPSLRFYDFPDSLESSHTKTVFMSSYFPWDSETHLQIALENGFKSLTEAREGTFRNYVGIDEHINRIHQYLKLLKFGYGRTTDHVCEEIRVGRITRLEGKSLISEYELRPPSIEVMTEVANFLQISISSLAEIMDSYRNLDLWIYAEDDSYVLPGFLLEDASPPVKSLRSLFP